jgi:hypothetical protein
MTPARLIFIGETIYGPAWHASLSRDLSVAERTMRRWINGEKPLPPKIGNELMTICLAQVKRLSILIHELQQQEKP